MSTRRSPAAASVVSTNADPLADVDPADLDRFVRHLAEAAASWHRRQAALMPCCSADRAELPRAA
ncbi:MAG TPA: hypothetical protein VFH48_28180 [Chloroflexota bacterium]|nr:hypothetical protein [Chloroflexota bacterium]